MLFDSVARAKAVKEEIKEEIKEEGMVPEL